MSMKLVAYQFDLDFFKLCHSVAMPKLIYMLLLSLASACLKIVHLNFISKL